MKLLLLVGLVLSVFCSSSNADDKKGPKVTDKVSKLTISMHSTDALSKNLFLYKLDKNKIFEIKCDFITK